MSQITYFGTDGAVQAGIYGGVSPITYEEGGTNGFGQRMTAVRQYYTDPTKAFQATDKAFFDTGHLMVVSVSNFAGVAANTPYWSQVSSGSLDSTYGAMFTRIAGWDFDANVTAQSRAITTTISSANIGGTFTGADVNATITGTGIQAGTTILSQTGTAAVMSKTATATGSPTASITQGLKAPYVYFIFQHEIDRPVSPRNTWGGAAAYVLASQHLYNLAQTSLANAGAASTRIRFCWCVTGFGVDQGRVEPFYPGNAFVDNIGVDPYTGPGGTTTFSQLVVNCLAYARTKNKSISYPEIANIQTDSVSVGNWYADMGTQIANSDVTCEFLCQWIGSTSNEPSNWWQFNFNKLAAADSGAHANPNKHSGLTTALATMGNNPIRTGVTQGKPSAPTGFAATSNSAGTQLTMTWAANPGGDNITGWDAYINPGNTQVLHKDNLNATLAATPRSYTFSNLTPGTQYSITAVAINSAGRSGYGTIIQAPTTQPGVTNHAPVIDSATVTPVAGTFGVNYSVTAHDPDSNPITYAWTVTDNHGSTQTSTAASGSFNFTSTGTFSWTVTVTDNGTPPLSTTQSGTFAITTNQAPNTTNFNWPLPLTGSDVRSIAPLLRGVFTDLDARLWTTATQPSPHNSIHGYVASSMDPANLGGATTLALTTNQLYWCAMTLQGTTITGITTLIQTSQSGTGSVVALYNSAGNMMSNDDGTAAIFSGTSVDTWLQAAAGPSDFTLPVPITEKLIFGSTVYVGVFNPTQATHVAVRTSASSAFVSSRNASTQYRSAVVGSQTTCPDPLPFANQAVLGNQLLAFYALF